MHFLGYFSLAGATLCVTALTTPLTSSTNAFKFQIVDPKKGKWFLSDATGAGTQDITKALDCAIASGIITCGGKGFDNYPRYGDMYQLTASSTPGSSGWAIDSDDKILWSAKPKINFDVGINGETNLWAETCPDAHGHWTGGRGYAKAVWA